jgi:hypothetical protein
MTILNNFSMSFCCKKMKWNWKTCPMKILNSSQNRKVCATSVMYTKVYRIKYITIIFVL